MAMHGQFLRIPWNLRKEDEIKEIILQPEIWLHDAIYHEAEHCM